MNFVIIITAWITFWLACLISQKETEFVFAILSPIIPVLMLGIGTGYLTGRFKLHIDETPVSPEKSKKE